MIYLYYTFFNEPFAKEQIQSFLADIGEEQASRVKRYKYWQDFHASLLGKLLLKQALHEITKDKYNLSDIKYDVNNRPCIGDDADFSISHSGNCVACAVAQNVKIGVDIEQIRTVNIAGLSKKILSANEYEHYKEATNKQTFFFDHWTQKEAVVKAQGIGLRVALNTVVIENGRCKIGDDDTWYLQKPNIAAGYVCNISCNKPMKASLKQVFF